MDKKIIEKMGSYYELYQYVMAAPRSKAEIIDFITVTQGLSKTTGKTQSNALFKGEFPMLKIEGDMVMLDELVYREFAEKVFSYGGANSYKLFLSPPPAPRGKNAESDIPSIGSVESPVVQDLQRQLNEQKAKVKELNRQLKGISAEHQAHIDELRNQHEQEMLMLRKSFSEELSAVTLQIVDETCENILSEMGKKMFVTQSIRSKPKEKLAMDVFLDDPAKTLDIPMLISKRGGEKDSIYEVIDEREKKLDPEDHIDRVSRGLFKTDIFKRRAADESRLRRIEKVTKKEKYRKRRQITDTEIYANRLQSINCILTNEDLSNQQKLAFYAGWSEYKGSDFAENLALAGAKGLDAGYVIRLLESPMEHDNYHNVRGFLLQALNSSEAKLKREAVKELICGEWIVEAEYDGKTCRFQMVPVDEIVAFKAALEKLKINEAIRRANNIIGVERIASFEDDDPRKKMYVERKKTVEEEKAIKEQEAVNRIHQPEIDSGIDVHAAVDIEYDDGFEEKVEAHGAGEE